MMKSRQLGKAFSIIARAIAGEEMMHNDIDAFYGEGHSVVSRNEHQRLRLARRHARAVSGLSRHQFNRALSREMTDRLLQTTVGRILRRSYGH